MSAGVPLGAVSVMSFNVRNMRANDGANAWEQRRKVLFDVVRRAQPDIVATQEGYYPQVEQIGEALPEYAMTGVGRDDGGLEGEFCAIFHLRARFRAVAHDTFWFSETPDVPGSRHWTPNHARVCTWVQLMDQMGKTFTVYNVHLDHESQSARVQSCRLLLETIRSAEHADPALIVGDFNMQEDNPAIASFADGPRPLRDCYRTVHPKAGSAGTFHGFTGREDGEKIDYIFASPEFQIHSAGILHDHDRGRYPSDHFPIIASVSLDA